MYTVELNRLLLLSLFVLLLCYVYSVYTFIFTDYLLRCSCFPIVIVYDCIWFCDDIVCILQGQYDNRVTAGTCRHVISLLNSRLYTPNGTSVRILNEQ